ncbi:MAG: hypothetical protein MUC66_00140 [Methanolinea sp.]|jgi:hypothetical protein|nr:hypothetical protein [Methanolinea sp.]
MRPAWYFLLLAAVLAGILFSCGCTSQTAISSPSAGGTSPVITPLAGTSPDSLPGIALELSDFPEGYELIYAGETEPPDESSLLSDPSYQGGYSVTVSNESSDFPTGELVDQIILIYSQPVTHERLASVFTENYPELSSWSLSSLADPRVGEASIAYHFAYPNTTLSGYTIVFGKGDVYEILTTMVGDGTADYDFLKGIAEKAAARVN